MKVWTLVETCEYDAPVVSVYLSEDAAKTALIERVMFEAHLANEEGIRTEIQRTPNLEDAYQLASERWDELTVVSWLKVEAHEIGA